MYSYEIDNHLSDENISEILNTLKFTDYSNPFRIKMLHILQHLGQDKTAGPAAHNPHVLSYLDSV